jgi:butyrate kinase
MSKLVLAVAPAANATAMALFRGGEPVRTHAARHADAELRSRRGEQRVLRARAVRAFLEAQGIARGELAAVVGRAGVLAPVEGGTYAICEALLRDAERATDHHPASLGAPIAHDIAVEWGCPAFVVDPDSVDERDALARLSQPCDLAPHAPALAMRSAARRHARAVSRRPEELRLVIAHLARTVSLCATRSGRMIDVVELWEGRRSRCGNLCSALPDTALADLPARTGTATPVPHGVPDLSEALARAERGDGRAVLVLQGAAYRIAKAVGELATVLEGEVDAVLLAGGLAAAGPIVTDVCRRVEWIAPVFLYRDEDELHALAQGALRVLTGEEPLKRYG